MWFWVYVSIIWFIGLVITTVVNSYLEALNDTEVQYEDKDIAFSFFAHVLWFIFVWVALIFFLQNKAAEIGEKHRKKKVKSEKIRIAQEQEMEELLQSSEQEMEKVLSRRTL